MSQATEPSGIADYFRDQAGLAPPGEACITAFYLGAYQLLKGDTTLGSILAKVQSARGLSKPYLANLLFRSVQYLQLFRLDRSDYLKFTTGDQWMAELSQLLSEPNTSSQLQDLLMTRNTQTSKYQRYAGVQAVLGTLWPDNPIRVLDFGCGSNVGLLGMANHVEFEPIIDETPGSIVIDSITRRVRLVESCGVDRHDPTTSESADWILACSYYPSEILISGFDRLAATTAQSNNEVEFQQLDLLSDAAANLLPSSDYNAVIMSTMLYQNSEEDRFKLIHFAQRLLREDGVLILQDFLTGKTAGTFEFAESWFDGTSYKTLLYGAPTNFRWSEIFLWETGRCRKVRAGEHLNVLLGAASTGKI